MTNGLDTIRLLAVASDAQLLTILSQPTALNRFAAIYRREGIAHDGKAKHNPMVDGYKLVVATALYHLLDAVIVSPQVFGLKEQDSILSNWWTFANRDLPLSAALSSTTTRQARMASLVDGYGGALPAASTLDDLDAALGELRDFAATVLKSAKRCVPVHLDGRPMDLLITEVIRQRSIERLLDYVVYREILPAHRYFWRERGRSHVDKGQYPLSDTHIDYRPSLGIGSISMSHWESGVIAATLIALRHLSGIRGRNRVYQLFRQIAHDQQINLKGFLKGIMHDNWPSFVFGLRSPLQFSGQDWNSLQSEPQPATALQRLEALFGKDNRVVAADDAIDALHLKVVLTGAVSVFDSGEKILVVRVQHSPKDDGITWYSLAIRFPNTGIISNMSKWWVFYKIYGEAGWPDPELTIPKSLVETTLAQFEDDIQNIELSGVSLGDFLDICSPGTWRRLQKQAHELRDTNSDLRGLIPELLAALQLANEGYHNISIRVKRADLGKMELDVVGVREVAAGEGEVLVVEVKGPTEARDTLKKEVTDFARKLDKLQKRKDQLAKVIGYVGDVVAISGRFLALTDVKRSDLANLRADIEVWDHSRFTRALLAHQPKRVVDLVRKRPPLIEWSLEENPLMTEE